jgi:hypothetical protein
MKRRNQDLLLGITAIVMLTLFMGTFLFLYNRLPPDLRPIQVYFRPEDGMVPLVKGGPVLLANAVNVGQVRGVELIQRETEAGVTTFILVHALIDQDLRLYKDAKINTNQPAVGGNGYLNIQSLGTPQSVLVADDEMIPGRPPESFAAAVSGLSSRILAEGGLMDQIEALIDPESEGSLSFKLRSSLEDVNAMTAQLRVQLSPQEQATLMAKLHTILDAVASTTLLLREQMAAEDATSAIGKVHAALDGLAAGVTAARDILLDAQPKVANTLSNVETASETIATDIVKPLAREFDASDPATLLGKVHQTMDGVQLAIRDLQGAMESGRRVVTLNEPVVRQILQNIAETSDQLKLGSAELRLNPSKLIWGPSGTGAQQNAAFAAARDFAEAATALDQAAARFQAFADATPAGAANSPAVQKQLRDLQAELQAAMSRLNRAEEYFYNQMKPVR